MPSCIISLNILKSDYFKASHTWINFQEATKLSVALTNLHLEEGGLVNWCKKLVRPQLGYHHTFGRK